MSGLTETQVQAIIDKRDAVLIAQIIMLNQNHVQAVCAKVVEMLAEKETQAPWPGR